jgi:hypothetical protein
MWEFHAAKEAVVKKLSGLDIGVVERIVLARDHRVLKWLLPSLNEYTKLPRSITPKDVDCLGLDFILKIVQVRESHKCSVLCVPETDIYLHNYPRLRYTHCSIDVWGHHDDFTKALNEAFREEIEQLERWNDRDFEGITYQGSQGSATASGHESSHSICIFFLVRLPGRLI